MRPHPDQQKLPWLDSRVAQCMNPCIGWRGGLLLAVLVGILLLPVWAQAQVHPADYIADENLSTQVRAHLQEHPEDTLLWQYRVIARAMQTGSFKTARILIDDAISKLQGLSADTRGARAESWWGRERDKTYIGDAHERSLLFFYRAIIYWQDGDIDNARACFRAALVEDMEVLTGESGDWITAEYLDGLLAARQGDPVYASESYARARKHWQVYHSSEDAFPLAPPTQQPNVHIFFTGGDSVEKERVRREPHLIEYDRGRASRARNGAGLLIGERLYSMPFQDDLLAQAVSNSRLMDEVLKRKAQDKENYEELSDWLIFGTAVASEAAPELQQGLAALAALSRLRSGFTRTEADVRYWDNAPSQVGYLGISLPPGEHVISLGLLRSSRSFHKAWENFTLIVPESGEVVIYLSDRMEFTD